MLKVIEFLILVLCVGISFLVISRMILHENKQNNPSKEKESDK